jgi:putative two-component system response regulator
VETVAAGEFPLPENTSIMVLDDDKSAVQAIGTYLSQAGYRVRGHVSARNALQSLSASPAALLILDLTLGDQSGIDVARAALEEDPSLAIIMIAAEGTEESAIECLRLGLSDYIRKPLSLEELAQSVQRALLRRASEERHFQLEQRLRAQLEDAQGEGRSAAVRALAQISHIMEAKQPHMDGHSERVAQLAESIGREMGLPPQQVIRLREAGLLHDVGMVAAPDGALTSDQPLTPAEKERIRNHAKLGADLARSLGLSTIAEYIEFHHERLDGSGYPGGLHGNDIPVGGLILGLAETFCALTEPRPYREAAQPRDALDTLRGAEGMWFPGALIDALERSVLSPALTPA